MIILDDLLTLDDAENILYELYLKYSARYQEPLKTIKQWKEDEKTFSEYQKIFKENFGGFAFFKENFSEDIFKADENVIIFKHPRYFPYFMHSHDFFEITYVLRGKYKVRIQDKLLELNPGDFLILAPKVRHCPQLHTKEDVVVDIIMRKNIFEKVFFDLLKHNPILATFFSRSLTIPNGKSYLKFSTQNDSEIEYILLSMLSEYQNKNSYYSTVLTKLASTLFILLLRNHSDTLNTAFNDSLQFSAKITAMIQYMNDNLKSVKFSELAKKFAYSERQLARLLIKYTGKSFTSILQELRLQKACLLLKEKDFPIREIIYECGCRNQSHFYKIFKNYCGKTPAQYRIDINSEKNISAL